MGEQMALPTAEPTVGETVSIEVECADCGHTRWLRPQQLRAFGVAAGTPLASLAERLSCSHCKAEGLPGKSISVQAAFATKVARDNAERWSAVKTQEARDRELRAISA